MFPYADNLTGRYRAPIVWTLIFALIAIWIVENALGVNQQMVVEFGFIPVLFSVRPWANLYTLLTANFLHGDFFHVAGNCLFLWVFGRSLERLFGWRTFIALFPFLGATGFLVQWLTEPESQSPIIGASGAIACLLGAYLALFPHAKMKVAIIYLPFWKRVTIPAWSFVAYWIGLQLVSFGLGSGQADGVAYAVHVGAFAVGLFVAAIWKTSMPMAEDQLADFIRTSFESQRPIMHAEHAEE
jgi:membrane associated rhomboid family serine protease